MRRIDRVGAALLVLASAAVGVSHGARDASARWYAEARDYNRAITDFLRENRGSLSGRRVAVLGVTGLSPWSHTTGAYVNRLVGSAVAWTVYVPREDIFYRVGREPHGTIEVRAEASLSCTSSDALGSLFLIVDSDGRASLADGCEQALQQAYPLPQIAAWGPKTVTPREAETGFDMFVTGRQLGAGTAVAVGGRPLSMVRAQRGALMTTRIPPKSAAGGVVRFTIEHRGTTVLHGHIDVGEDARRPRG